MKRPSLDRLMEFMGMIHQLQQIKRMTRANGEDRQENDAEHSYLVGMTAWYIIEAEQLDLDATKALKLGLVHDIVEVYAGDTPVFGPTVADQHEKELKALAKLKRDWPELAEIWKCVDEYEAQATAESRFVYALDKLLPVINNYLGDGINWKLHAVTLDQMKAKKVGKVTVDPVVADYYDQIVKVLEDRPDLFVPLKKLV